VLRPNVLLIHTDQHRWDTLGANGNDEIRTPNLDEFAGEGVNFERCFVQNPLCMPSRASIFSGQYPSQLDIYTNGIPFPTETPTVADMMDNYGYDSAAIGKFHLLPHSGRDHREIHPQFGFDRLEVADEPGEYPDAYRAWVEQRAPDQVEEIGPGLTSAAEAWRRHAGYEDEIDHPEHRTPKRPVPFPADDDLTHSAFVADRAMDFLEEHEAGRPFFCSAGFYSPHSPWIVPQRYLDMYDPTELSAPEFPPDVEAERNAIEETDDPTQATFSDEELRRVKQGYYAMVTEVDHHVGRILSTLDELGLRENTVVVFLSDHGEYLGEHLKYSKGWPGYDCISHIPLLVRWAEGIENPDRTEDHLLEAVDIVPTLLDCAGIPIPPHLQGRSFLPLLRDEAFEGRDSALLEMHRGKTLRTDRYRYVAHQNGEEALYDLAEDPDEYNDISDDEEYADVRCRLRHELLERILTVDRENERPHEWAH